MNYFNIFDLSEDFFIDIMDLTDIYQEKQRQYHPDRFAATNETERLKALQMATQINAAYQTLKDPLSRAAYLLQLRGFDIQNESFTFQDNEFLQHQFELREKIEILQSNTSMPVEDLLVDLTVIVQQINAEERHIKNDLFIATEDDNWEEVATCLRKLKYYERLLAQIDEIEENLFT